MKIIQIGTNNGKDHVFDHVSANKDSIELVILVEPIPQCIPDIVEQYKDIPNTIVENIAITNDDTVKTMPLYYLVGSNYEGSSFSKSHVESLNPYGVYTVAEMQVPCMTVGNLMDKHGLTFVDHLYIDAEALDYAIVSGIDFTKYSFKTIEFESFHAEKPEAGGEGGLGIIIELLSQAGYKNPTTNFLNLVVYNENLL
jgi:FkbM family methyltransferase